MAGAHIGGKNQSQSLQPKEGNPSPCWVGRFGISYLQGDLARTPTHAHRLAAQHGMQAGGWNWTESLHAPFVSTFPK